MEKSTTSKRRRIYIEHNLNHPPLRNLFAEDDEKERRIYIEVKEGKFVREAREGREARKIKQILPLFRISGV